MKTFEFGAGIRCNVDILIDTRMLIQSNSGGGKSWCIRRLLEQTHGMVQHLVIDPEGEFSTLRERFDYVLAAKNGGDTAADPRSAKLLAERLLELGVSAVMDIYELKAHERIRFVRHFLEALVDAPKKLWHPVLIIVDEAQLFAPQDEDAESYKAVIELAKRGRKRGMCAVLAVQRLSELHKSAAAECNNRLMGRTGLDTDIKRVSNDLGFIGRAEAHELRVLKPGQFFAYGPALCSSVTRLTIGAVATTHPKAGARIAFTPPPPTAKVKALLPKLSDLPAEAEQQQRTLDDLRRDLAAAHRENAMLRKATQQVPTTEKIIEVPVLKESQIGRLAASTARIERACGAVTRLLQDVSTGIARASQQRHSHGMPTRAMDSPKAPQKQVAVKTPRAAITQLDDSGNISRESLTGPEQRVLDGLAWLENIGVLEAEQSAAAFLADYTLNGSFYNARGALHAKGLVEYLHGSKLRMTERGRSCATALDIPATAEALQSKVLERLPEPERRVLRPLLKAYPEPVDNETLAAAAKYTLNGSFFNARGRLRSLGLVEYRDSGVVAKALLFPDREEVLR